MKISIPCDSDGQSVTSTTSYVRKMIRKSRASRSPSINTPIKNRTLFNARKATVPPIPPPNKAALSASSASPTSSPTHALPLSMFPTLSLNSPSPFLKLLFSTPSFPSTLTSSPLLHALSSFDDDPIAQQLIDIISALCASANDSVTADFIAQVSGKLSSGALAWSRRQLYMLHCLGVLLNRQINDPCMHIRDKDALVSNLVAVMNPRRDSFVLYKLSAQGYASKDCVGANVLHAFCPSLLRLSMEALLKTQRDDVRLNGIGSLLGNVLISHCKATSTNAAAIGLFGNGLGNEISSLSSDEADHFMQTTEEGLDESPLSILFAEAIKGPLLSSDSQVQISTLDLIFHYLSCGDASPRQIQILVEENIVDYVFEILRLSECKDPLVYSCVRVLNLFPCMEQSFRQRLIIGFPTLIPVLRYVSEVPFHPAQAFTLMLIQNCVSDCPGIASTSNIDELALILSRMFERHRDGEIGMIPETFVLVCSIFVVLLKFPSSQGASNLPSLLQEALKHAVLACLTVSENDPGRLLHSLYLLKEAYSYSQEECSANKSSNFELRTSIVEICTSHILPWFSMAVNELNEETVMGVFETFHFILVQNPDIQATELAKVLLSSSWFSFSFGCLGLFPAEMMKWRVYLMLSSLVEVLLGNQSGQHIRDAAFFLPSDPIDLLFLLGQKNSRDVDLSSCQAAVLLLLHFSCLHDDWLADERSVLASLEQYILVNSGDFLSGSIDSLTMMQVLNLYGLCRGLSKLSNQVSHSLEAERILFHMLSQSEWDLHSATIHPVAVRWLFQQEKISKPLSSQLLKFCRIDCSDRNQILIHRDKSHIIDLSVIADLVATRDNHAAKLLVCLLVELAEEGAQNQDIITVVNLISAVINIFPAASDQLCLHGIGNSILMVVYYNSGHSSSSELLVAILLLLFNILSTVHHETLSDGEPWLALSTKLIECLIPEVRKYGWNHEGLILVGILSLILHHSSGHALIEATKSIIFNASLISIINSTVQVVTSKGPALIEYDEGTSSGESLILLLLLYYFTLRCFRVILPEVADRQTFLESTDMTQSVSTINIHHHDLCRMIHFGSPIVKLVASSCLLEFLSGISYQKKGKHVVSQCYIGYLKTLTTVLEGQVFNDDIRVAMNCCLCLSIILGWEKELEMQESGVVRSNWYRLIVEEMVMSMAVPCLASKSFINHHKPAVHLTVALLKLEKTPGWMRIVFDDLSLSSIIENLKVVDVSSEMVLLFRALLESGFLKAEHITSLNIVFQACRKRMYNNGKEQISDKHARRSVTWADDPAEICEYLVHLMVSRSCSDTDSGNRRLSDEIDKFSRSLTEGTRDTPDRESFMFDTTRPADLCNPSSSIATRSSTTVDRDR
ncbi:pentatricopeptide repeat-containing protein [Hibiscus syriacus]|uniref:Pentatricopeptide repeat-containing protein n=1 Tax=Hibiscus syriacus TaxID=106335 RepID=A0A6A2XMI5_HIBSY|nr:pentatricopeptide repeat-containing protein [Hibiscus syriacus]